MICIDPSAVLAILKEEADATQYRQRLQTSERRVITAVGRVEAAVSLGRSMKSWEVAEEVIEEFCAASGIEVVAVTPDLCSHVIKAYRRFGKGQGHPAQLNFGDCFSYAFAKVHDLPLLFKGNDFLRTDITSAI
ncbi:type II toxin-antitoxin system VapC family toxin [Aminobacter sp. J44]|uniref:type II toxin-antitoxin system VapC family toxin n=1 Tax=Aminobacter sp. J44 TaxID=935262 RepID=UPI001198F928|nr:type II toxin-antitoxin system VapC family toxin [Aminobacter sp. J44]TWG61348.1 ribonuclease VapC [Aminobacter sp. J44]